MRAARPVPRLTDGVVELRPPVEEDAEAIVAACQDPDIGRFTLVPVPYGPGHAAEWIGAAPDQWRSGTTRPMVVLDAVTGELLGSCGLTDVGDERAEIGYWVKREARGRGVASRAVRLVTEWALAEAGLCRVELLTDVGNLASQRVAEKAGYTREGEVPAPPRCAGRWELMVRFARERPGR